MYSDFSGGSGLTIRSNIGIGLTLPFAPGVPAFNNWDLVYFQGNNGVQEGPGSLTSRIYTNSSTGTVTTTTDVTAGILSLVPGTYRLSGVVQTIISSGGGTATQLACTITTASGGSGLSNAVSPLIEGASQTQSFGTNQDARVNCSTIVQVFTTTSYFLRVHIVLSGSITEGYAGLLRAELIE
jgi:hypothetical protein